MTEVLDKPTTSPISTRKHGDVLIIRSNNPPVNALGHAVRAGAGRGDRGGRGRRQRQSGGHRLRRPDLFRRRRRLGIRHAQGVRAADAAAGRRPDREPAPSRWSRRSTARRSAAGSRSRWPAIIASRCRRRSWACPKSSSACSPARAEPSGCRAWPASARRSKCARPAIRSAPRKRSIAGWSTG